MLKIDVEGVEGEVIRGLEQTQATPTCHTVLIEMHFTILAQRGFSDAPQKILQSLKSAGFTEVHFPDASHLFATKPR
jgi:hypothetical protein